MFKSCFGVKLKIVNVENYMYLDFFQVGSDASVFPKQEAVRAGVRYILYLLWNNCFNWSCR